MSGPLLLRDAEDRDAPAVAAIYAPYVRDTAISFESEPPDAATMLARLRDFRASHLALVADDAGRVVGYAYASSFRARPAYRFTCETTVYVERGLHRRGVGRALMTELLARLRAAGFHRAVAGVTLPNAASVALHEALGFRPVGVFREVGRKFGAWHDVGFWDLALGNDVAAPVTAAGSSATAPPR